jgi:hypothetical protein
MYLLSLDILYPTLSHLVKLQDSEIMSMRHIVAGTLNTCGRAPPEEIKKQQTHVGGRHPEKKIKIINLELDKIG